MYIGPIYIYIFPKSTDHTKLVLGPVRATGWHLDCQSLFPAENILRAQGVLDKVGQPLSVVKWCQIYDNMLCVPSPPL